MDNTCVCCGAVIPEGRQVCKACEEGFVNQNRESLRKLGEILENISGAFTEAFISASDNIEEGLIESFAAAKDALLKLIKPIMDVIKDFARKFGELIAQDIEPKTIPPRHLVRCIGCRPETRNRKPTVIRRGCRHK